MSFIAALVVPVERIERSIFLIRGERVILVEMSVFVVRAFVRLRSMLATHKALAAKVGELERMLTTHDEQIIALIQAIKRLMTPPELSKKRRIGFHAKGGQ